MFKKFFNPKQNQDPTLYEKGWGVYKFGRFTSWIVLILGTALVYLLSTWLTNAVEAGLVAIFSEQFGALSGKGLGFIWTVIKAELGDPTTVFNNEGLIGTLSLLRSHMWISWLLHWAIFFAIWYFGVWRLFYSIFAKSRDLNHHEYGKSRLATPKEVANETYKVPDRTYRYNYPNGFPVMHTFNWRGYLNKWVKTQFSKTKQITEVHDSDLPKIFMLALSIIGAALFFCICGISAGSAEYHQSHHVASIWVIPYYIWHFTIKTCHLVFTCLYHICHFTFHLQGTALKQPFYNKGLFFLFEILLIAWAVFHIVDSIKALHRSWLWSLISNRFSHMNEFGHKLPKFFTLFSKNGLHDLFTSQMNKVEGFAESPVKDSMGTVHAINAFFHHPKATTKLALMEVVQVLFPLDKGITGWYYLSPRPHNVLVYGTSGSGKGQMIVNPVMDINSRTSRRYQPNMIITDPKGESAAGAYAMLKRRGYDVKVMNILDLSHSMSFNPLRLVKKYAQLGAIGQAEEACSMLSDTIYDPKGTGSNSYFYTSAGSLFDAMTFGLLALAHSRFYGLDDLKTQYVNGKKLNVREDGLAHRDKQGHNSISVIHGIPHSSVNAFNKITIYNILQMETDLGGEYGHVSGQHDTVRRLNIYFKHLSHKLQALRQKDKDSGGFDDVMHDQLMLISQAINKFNQFNQAGSKEASSILSTFINRLKIYQSSDTAHMTSMDDFNPAKMGFDRLLTVQFNRLFKLQDITARSWARKPIIASVDKDTGKVSYRNAGDMYISQNETHHKVTEDDVIETNKIHLSQIGLAQIPFAKAINHHIFYVTIDLYDEIANYNFHFSLKCIKRFYNAEDVIKARKDYHEAPKFASIDVVQAYLNADKSYRRTDSGQIIYAKDQQGNPLSAEDAPQGTRPMAIDHYTKKPVLDKIEMSEADVPDSSIYNSNVIRSQNSDHIRLKKLDRLAKHPSEAIKIHQAYFLYNPRPTAWFVVVPQNKQTLNQLGTFAIDQTFNVLSNISMMYTKGRHVQRPIQMILDELGNLPAIPHLGRKASFGRSQHIYLMPIFQDKSQSLSVYGPKTTDTLFNNCPTKVFILSSSQNTLKDISQSGGNRTVINTSLSHNPTKLKSVDYNGNSMKQAVIPMEVLRNLRLGEAFILRTTDRSDVWGHDTSPLPIFDWDGQQEQDNGKYKRVGKDHRLPYAWWFLSKSFNHGSLGAVPVVTPHKYLNLESLNIPYERIYEWMEVHEPIDTMYPQKLHDNLVTVVDRLPDSQYKDLYNNELDNANFAINSRQPLKIKQGLNTLIRVQKEAKLIHPLKNANQLWQYSEFILSGLSKRKDFLNYISSPKFIPKMQIGNIQELINALNQHFASDKYENSLMSLKRFMGYYNSVDPAIVFHGYAGKAASAYAVNNTMNTYLSRIGILDANKNSWELGPIGNTLITHSSLIETFLRKDQIDLGTQLSMGRLIGQLLQSLQVPKVYRKYRGLIFMMKLFNQNLIYGFTHTADGRLMNVPVNVYANVVLIVFDALAADISNSKTSTNVKGATIKISKSLPKLIRELNTDNKDI